MNGGIFMGEILGLVTGLIEYLTPWCFALYIIRLFHGDISQFLKHLAEILAQVQIGYKSSEITIRSAESSNPQTGDPNSRGP